MLPPRLSPIGGLYLIAHRARRPLTLAQAICPRPRRRGADNEVSKGGEIKTSVETLRTRKKKTEYPGPNESTLTKLPSLTSTPSLTGTLHNQSAQPEPMGTHRTTAEPPSAEVAVKNMVTVETSKLNSKSLLPHHAPTRQVTDATVGSQGQQLENKMTQNNIT